MKKRVLVAITAATAALALAACSSSGSSASTETEAATTVAEETTEAVVSTDAAVGVGDAAGFTEIPIFEDEELDFINLSAVYFQPVPMSAGEGLENYGTEGFDLHLEADISALENDLGYGVGDWIPYLTVDYAVVGSDGQTAAEGTFMPMSASDGPHYGANIALPNADTYSVTFTIHSPGESGYLIHTDAETGPGGILDSHFADGNITYTFEGWDYTPQEW